MKCPTCGSDCEIYSSGEGTNSYISVDVKAEKLELLDELLNRIQAAPVEIYQAIGKLYQEIKNE